jgi:outer membrane protein TolC
MAVGSPIPFWHFTTSNFAYVGLGVSEHLPFPGKLALRGRAAAQASREAHAALEAVQRRVRADLKDAYAQLGAVQQALAILTRDQQLLDQVEQIAEARYRVGQGDQQSVLEAQLQRTKILRDEALRRQDRETLEAQLKQVLGRSQDSPDVTAAPPVETRLGTDLTTLLHQVATDDPAVLGRQAAIGAGEARVAIARKDFNPDFTAAFMWQHTAPAFPDYYMFTFGVSVPVFQGRRQAPALAEATAQLASARAGYTSQVQMAQAALRDRFARAQTSARLLTMYREGLLPQARAAFQAGLASYQSGRLDFQSLIDSFSDVLTLDTAYWQTLADHNSAVARIEQITGVTP